jgi:ADP-dependent NAD(P)H-hydrate dehydratase / NAD(P)H-hydrate epimerase
MRLLATAESMRGYDRAAIERLGIPGIVLMENAGRCCVEEIARKYGDPAGKHVVIACGKGNNGGDGFVIARHLLNRQAKVDLLMLASPRQLAGDAATNFAILRKMRVVSKGQLRVIRVARGTPLKSCETAALFIDAIFGTGFSGSPKAVAGDLIRWINKRRGNVVAVDIPSGIAASTGEATGDAIRAGLTVTMACDKIGLHVGRGRECSGEVRVVDISIPPRVITAPRRPTYRLEPGDITALLPRRPLTAHKYSVGKVLVIAGSRSFTGAPVLTALGGLKAGAGAVVLCVPRSIHGMLVRKLTDVILTPCPETVEGTLGMSARAEIEKRLPWADVVILGPGLSREEETDSLMRGLVTTIDCPLILDADGLNALEGNVGILRKRKGITIITPHTGELSRLVGGDSATHELMRVEAARDAAQRTRSIVVLKGAPTVTAHNGVAVVNATGNPGMATIGSGDVLSGIIAGLIGQRVAPFAAAYAGVYLHGRAGDLAAAEYGERGILATDILAHVPHAFRQHEPHMEEH